MTEGCVRVEGVGPPRSLIPLRRDLLLTELLSNATLRSYSRRLPCAGEASIRPRPFLIAVCVRSASGRDTLRYQTNVSVYQWQDRYMDFVKVGMPLNVITMIAGIAAITIFFPF